jgi:inositol-hexakisphosphate/diphosphoinositol-pentakisphosphate 1-kinase
MYGGFKGINRKVQLKPKKWSVEKDKDGVPRRIATEVLLVLKWGGVLTERGELQASHIGKTFRAAMYPKTDVLGLGLLRLHSTFRHDLKIYSSDEGRCLMTAAAFAKSFLDLEGELPPILTSLVRPAPLMLNSLPETAREKLNEIKTRLHKDLATASKVDDDLIEKIAPTRDQELLDAVNSLSPNPRKRLYRLSELLTTLVEALRKLHAGGKKSLDEIELYVSLCVCVSRLHHIISHQPPCPHRYGGESLLLMYNRWKKLQRDLYHKRKDRFDMSKIPDVYDTVVYDLLHNRKFFRNHAHLKIVMDELYCLAKASASLVISQEYGVTKNEKLTIACSVADNLFYKVHADLVNASTGDDENGDTRLDADFIEVSENVRIIALRDFFSSSSSSSWNELTHIQQQQHHHRYRSSNHLDDTFVHVSTLHQNHTFTLW